MTALPLLLAFILLGPFLRLVNAAFVETLAVNGVDNSKLLLSEFIIDVGMDHDRNLLKFFINTKVRKPKNHTTNEVLITDVNDETNKYTTLHVDIDFMGKTFILENLRFCDHVSVKNTSGYFPSTRYPLPSDDTSSSSSSSSLTSSATSSSHSTYFNESTFSRRKVEELPKVHLLQDIGLIGSSNASVTPFFSNDTGNLVQCPLYQNDSIVIYYQADVSDHPSTLGSYNVKFTVVSNDKESDIIGAAQTHVTPVLQPRYLSSLLIYGVLAIIIVAGFVNYFITIFSPDQESNNPFLVEASTICNGRLLRQLSANTNIIVHYFQFAFFMAGLDLQYPGFLQPFLGQIRWCALLGLNVFRHTSVPLLDCDNIFITLSWTGLKSLALYGSNSFFYYSWPNFIICLLLWISATVIVHQFFIMLKLCVNRRRCRKKLLLNKESPTYIEQTYEINKQTPKLYSVSKNLLALLGHFFRQFLYTFELAFLVLTFFMLYTAGKNGKRIFLDQSFLRARAFDFNVPYNYLKQEGPLNLIEKVNYHLSPKPTTGDIPVASIICGSLAILAWLLAKLYFVFKYLISYKNFRLSTNANVTGLYTEVKSILLWAYFYNSYLPAKTQYVIVDFVYVTLVLIVIALVQVNGALQVVFLIIIEFIMLVLLLTVKPFYLKMTWHSLYLITHIARLLVLFLSIPYIRGLGVSETPRTYVAYIQLVIHLIVSIVFVIQLIYCLYLTMVSRISSRKQRKMEKYSSGIQNSNLDQLKDDFEYYPVVYSCGNASSAEDNTKLGTKTTRALEQTIGEEEDFEYYRSRSDKILRKTSEITGNLTVAQKNNEEETSLQDVEIFNDTGFEVRRRLKDYTTREGDLIYEKYFSSDVIDPEIKKLWASRLWNMDGLEGNSGQTPSASGMQEDIGQPESWAVRFLRKVKFKREPVTRGFEVYRPKPLTAMRMNNNEDRETDIDKSPERSDENTYGSSSF